MKNTHQVLLAFTHHHNKQKSCPNISGNVHHSRLPHNSQNEQESDQVIRSNTKMQQALNRHQNELVASNK